MKRIEQVLLTQIEKNTKLINDCENQLKEITSIGALTIKRTPTLQFYIKNASVKEYAHIGDPRIKQLAQKRYLELSIRCAQEENAWIQKFLDHKPKKSVKDIYSNNEIRRSLITPIELTDSEYVEQWLAKPYVGKDMQLNQVAYETDKGELVRSKSELLIANKLNQLGIPYRYEYPITLKSDVTVYPDFVLLKVSERKDYIYEHFGMMDDPEYSKKALAKIRAYEQNGFYLGDRLIVTFEDSLNPINIKDLERKLKALILKD